jgi:hypothetical protein
MKFYITLLVMIVVMILIAPAFAGEEPYNAAVYEDSEIPPFYISQKLAQFTHPETFYYGHCYYYFCNPTGPVDPEVCVPLDGNCFICSSKCQERFSSNIAPIFPEVCCIPDTPDCPNVENSRITAGYSGWYEWVIGLPNMPEGELNIEIECGILKPNALSVWGPEAINICAGETGEKVGNLCTRLKTPDGGNTYLASDALPMIEAVAYPGAQNNFKPFHLTAYRNPGEYRLKRDSSGKLLNNAYTQVLGVDLTNPTKPKGLPGTRIALKACMGKTILVKVPRTGDINAMGETEYNLEAGDLIKVRMDIPMANTVDIYCSQYSVKIGGIGEPPWAPAGEIDCLYDECCLDGCCINDECGQ